MSTRVLECIQPLPTLPWGPAVPCEHTVRVVVRVGWMVLAHPRASELRVQEGALSA